MKPLTIVALTLAGAALVTAAGAAIVVYGGLYNVAATVPHVQPLYSLLETAMHHSVQRRARDIVAPPMGGEQTIARGAACYQAKCVQCHGAPGVAQHDIGKSMQPLPGPLVDAASRWKPREMFWLTKHGILMSGMPAWGYRMTEDDMWAVVAFLGRLPELTPRAYKALTPDPVGSQSVPPAPVCERPPDSAGPLRDGDPELGKKALYQYACTACHSIPDTTSSSPHVGPPLAGIARRALIAGQLANTPDNMVRWLRHTHEVDPLSAMPEMGVGAQDARDITAFLTTLK